MSQLPQITFFFFLRGIASSLGGKNEPEASVHGSAFYPRRWNAGSLVPGKLLLGNVYLEPSQLGSGMAERKVFETQGTFKSFIPCKIQLLFRGNGGVKYSCSSIKGLKASLNWN